MFQNETPERAAKRRAMGCYTLAESVAAYNAKPPPTKAQLAAEAAAEAAERIEACKRAELKGDRALELLRSPECDPRLRPRRVMAMANDFDVE